MTCGLLVSVTNLHEARTAAELGVDIVDIKDPNRGALGAADPELWQAVADKMDSTVVLSAALGEASEAFAADCVPMRFGFAKAGPAGCQTITDLNAHWERIRQQLASPIQLVAVAYADYERAACPSPELILKAAASQGFRWWLIDTFVKDGRTTLDQLGDRRLAELDIAAKNASIRWVLAGSLQREALTTPWSFRPDFVGLRGDVCEQGRTGSLSANRVKRWQRYLRELE